LWPLAVSANALHQAGDPKGAATLFAEAECW
jgi:hypothetical protein